MKTKEEYVQFVKEWKITHEALVKLQLYVKKYLIKSVYKNQKFKLSDEELEKCLKRYNQVYCPQSWHCFHIGNIEKWKDDKRYSLSGSYKWVLKDNLNCLYESRRLEKDNYKKLMSEA